MKLAHCLHSDSARPREEVLENFDGSLVRSTVIVLNDWDKAPWVVVNHVARCSKVCDIVVVHTHSIRTLNLERELGKKDPFSPMEERFRVVKRSIVRQDSTIGYSSGHTRPEILLSEV